MLLLLSQFCDAGQNLTGAFPQIEGNHTRWEEQESAARAARAAQESKAINLRTIWISCQINCVIAVVQLLLFWILLRWKPHILAPKLPPNEAAKVPRWPLGWACQVWHVTRMGRGRSARHIAAQFKNLDGAVMVRYCILGFKLSFMGCLCACFLLPWYRHAGQEDPKAWPGEDSVENPVEYNLSNLQGGRAMDGRFWPAIVAAYFVVFVFIHFSIEEWCNFDIMRKEHFTRLATGGMEAERPGAAQAQRSILVEMVPPKYRCVTGVSVRSFFSMLFPHGGVHSAVVQAETGELHGKVDAVMMYEGRKTLRALREALSLVRDDGEDSDEPELLRAGRRLPLTPPPEATIHWGRSSSVMSLSGDEGLPSSHGSPPLSRSGTGHIPRARAYHTVPWRLSEVAETATSVTTAAIGHGRNVAEGLWQRAQQAAHLVQDITLAHDGGINVGSSTAFVTFNTVSDRVAAEQMVLCQSDIQWQALTRQGWFVTAAPEKSDIVWKNAAVPHAQAWARSLMVRITLLFSMIFWVIPIALITVWTRIDNWHFEWIQKLQGNAMGQFIYTLVSSYLPVLAQMGLMYALPVLLEQLAIRVEGVKVKSRIQVTVVARYLQFLMVTIYCTIIQGSLLESVCEILQQPWDLFDLLQQQVPKVACQFITYAMARAGLSAPMLLLFPLLSAFDEKDDKGRILIRPNYAMEASNLVLMLVLGMTYCVIAPMIMIACMIYFALTSLVYSWLFLYVYTPEFDCVGKFWSYMFIGSIWSLLFGVAALAGIASTYVGPTSGCFAACLVLCVIIVLTIIFFHYTYDAPSCYIPLEVAREVDHASVKLKVQETFKADYYFDPVITGQSVGLLSSDAGCCFCCRRSRIPEQAPEGHSTSSEREHEEVVESDGGSTESTADQTDQEDERHRHREELHRASASNSPARGHNPLLVRKAASNSGSPKVAAGAD